jgi:hypothetical protein
MCPLSRDYYKCSGPENGVPPRKAGLKTRLYTSGTSPPPEAHRSWTIPGTPLDGMSSLTNNRAVVRKSIAFTLSLAIQVAALSAPLVHAHPDDHATAHHDGNAVHTHWAGHQHQHPRSDGPAITSPDEDRAIFMSVFVAEPTAATRVVAIAQTRFVLLVPTELTAHSSVDVTHGHDPPALHSLPARAPPALLS